MFLHNASSLFLILLLVYLSHWFVDSAITTISFENRESKSVTSYTSPVESYVNTTGLNTLLSSNANVTLLIWLAHVYNEDLRFYLLGPDGSNITLSYYRGDSNDNVFNGTLFTDSASNSVVGYSYKNNVVATPLRPEQPLSNFRGKNPNGQWGLQVDDDFYLDDGQLYGFTLNIQGKKKIFNCQ